MKRTISLILVLLLSSFTNIAQVVGTPKMIVKKKSGIPGTIVLGSVPAYQIGSVYDTDYLPYTLPIVAANNDTAQPADGVNETVVLDVQGTLTTIGVSIYIPYTVTGSTTLLPAYTQTISIPASLTQDGIGRDLNFSYDSASYPVGIGYITATLKAIDGNLNIKKLDVQSGIGINNLGVLLAKFTYAVNSAGDTTDFDIAAIAAIPDREYADANHRFLYMPVNAKDGRTWLNSNLGSNFSNINSTSFNLVQQAITNNDYNGRGSYYQWGRYSDGHELSNFSSSCTGGFCFVNGVTTTLSASSTAPDNLFIRSSTAPNNWLTSLDNNLWQGKDGINNPCPIGYKIPTINDFTILKSKENITNSTSAFNSSLKFILAGFRNNSNGTLSTGSGAYNSSSISGTSRTFFYITTSNTQFPNAIRCDGYSTRCIKE